MAGSGRQLLLLLWKNWILQKRKIAVSVFEILLPVFFCMILLGVRFAIKAKSLPPTSYDPFDLSIPKLYDNSSDKGNSLDLESAAAQFGVTLQPGITGIPPGVTGIPPALLAAIASGAMKTQLFLGYTPQTNVTVPLMQRAAEWMDNEVTVTGFPTEASLEEFMKNNVTARYFLGGVVFYNVLSSTTVLPKKVSYAIRLNSTKFTGDTEERDRWRTEATFRFRSNGGPRPDTHGYHSRGFLTIQRAVDLSIIEIHNSSVNLSSLEMWMERYPYPSWLDDNYITIIQSQLPLLLMLCFILNAIQITKNIVFEKERRLKESMKMMGLSGWLHWLAWFIKCFIYFLLAVILMTLVFNIPIQGNKILGDSSPVIILLFLISFALATIAFAFAVSVFFSKSNAAAAVCGILYFLSYMPYFFLQLYYEDMTWSQKMACMLLPNMGLAFGGNLIGLYMGTGSGVQIDNFTSPAVLDDNLSLLHVIIMLLVDAAIGFFIAWYIEAVFPGEYGIPQPPYFPFLKSYWCGTATISTAWNDDEDEKNEGYGQNPMFFDKEPVGLKVGVSVKNLKKVFAGNKVAVAGMKLNMYENQVFALLGHNGAGKTTTMSMLTGFIPPSGGTAVVNGYDIRHDINSVRDSLGLCPQHDILFDSMTVEEHLIFFAKLKGMSGRSVKEEVDKMLVTLGLVAKKEARSATLSGGQKRKLSVGIALIGGSKVVILDEPTSGMDPNARRQTWDIIQNARQGRTILLTTHFMEEADLLGDRIAIMGDGIVKCCGTSLFLKNKYGAGYHMILVKTPSCKVEDITALLQQHVKGATMESDLGAELSYILPREDSAKFENLFEELERSKERLGISSFGASVTTMEEVFLRVAEGISMEEPSSRLFSQSSLMADEGMGKSKEKLVNNLKNGMEMEMMAGSGEELEFNIGLEQNTGIALWLQQFQGMFIKKLLHTWRHRAITIAQLFIPVLFTCLALVVDLIVPEVTDDPALKLDLSPFDENFVTYAFQANHTVISNMGNKYLNQFSLPTKLDAVDVGVNNLSYTMEQHLLQKSEDVGISNYNQHHIVGATVEETVGSLYPKFTAYYNGEPYHASPISLNSLSNGILKYFTGVDFQIEVTNHPLPLTTAAKIASTTGTLVSATAFTIALNVLFGMAYLASSFVSFIVREKASGAKHLQFVSGASSFLFWAANFVWDMLNYLLPCLLILVIFAAFGTEAYVGDGRLLLVLLLLLLFGWATLPFMYLLSFGFKTPATATVVLTIFNIIVGLGCLLVVLILDLVDDPPETETKEIADALEWVFLILFPNYSLGQGLQSIYYNWQYTNTCTAPGVQELCAVFPGPCCRDNCPESSFCLTFQDSYLAWEKSGIGRNLVFLAIQGFVYFALVGLIESGILGSIAYRLCNADAARVVSPEAEANSEELDGDVAEEQNRVNSASLFTLQETDALLIRGLTKYYDNFLAVNRLSLGIPKGELFGLLGVNGAGKTSTFKMLTGDIRLSEGNAYLDGYDIRNDLAQVRSRMGYCPQFDALIEQLTAREMLTMFARLRGIRSDQVDRVVSSLLATLLLEEYADKQCGNYSGGNKRKLSTAIALIGDPPVVFLDEPSTGVDPAARRQLWDTLTKVRNSGRTIILTSHSMEECEALCTRLAIMVNGQFRCLGSVQHLKSKFGQGYTLIAKVRFPPQGEPDIRPLMQFIETSFPGSVLKDTHQGYVHYEITDRSVSWARLFGMLERAKPEFNIEDYSVSQTTLEQVFLNFAREQRAPLEVKRRGCLCCK